MSKISRQSLSTDFRKLGICEGDVVFIKGNVGEIGAGTSGEFEGRLKDFFVDALLDVVGENGTIVTASYSELVPIWKLRSDTIFTEKSSAKSCGAIPQLFKKKPTCLRSKHPSNSCMAIGKDAVYILEKHDASAPAYSFFDRLLELDAKLISFGCLDTVPGIALHYTEEKLGLTKKTFLKFFCTYYFDQHEKKRLFFRKDPGGCYLKAGYSLYKEYHDRGVLRVGKVGKALAIGINLRDAFVIDYEIVSKDPGYICCDNPNCFRCNFLMPRKKHAILKFLTYRGWIMGAKVINRMLKGERFLTSWRAVTNPRNNYKINEDSIFKDLISFLL